MTEEQKFWKVSNIHAISTERGLQLISHATNAGRASGGRREYRENAQRGELKREEGEVIETLEERRRGRVSGLG
jgi:hypothetical protein